jgi:hypothetical protein
MIFIKTALQTASTWSINGVIRKSTGKVLSFTATYSEPLSKYLNAVIRYNYNRNNNFSDKLTNRFNAVTGKYDLQILHLPMLFKIRTKHTRLISVFR